MNDVEVSLTWTYVLTAKGVAFNVEEKILELQDMIRGLK